MGRTPCCNADGLKKGAWTADEDQKLIAYIQEHGEGGWRTLPQKAGLQRCGKSCRLRWANYLRPDIKRGEFSTEEEQKIIQLHASLGNRWSAIARHLPKRTDNEIKNYWNTHLKKRLAEMGIDPVTHKPFGPSSPTTENDSNPTHKSPHSQLTQPTTQAQLLNKLAAKLAPSRCLEALKTSQSPSLQSLSTEDGKNVLPKRPISSTSARLLNKMASRLTTPLHCLNTLKSILSSSLDYQSEGHNAIEAPHHDDFMHRSTSDSSLSETGSDMSRSNALATPDLSPLMESFNLDLLKDWNGVDDGRVSSINMVDTYSSCWDSPFTSFKNKKTFSGSESMHEVLDALTYNDSDKTYGSAQYDNYFMDGFSNFSINGCSEGSHEGRVFEGATYSWHNDHFFENNYQLPDSNVV